MSKVFIDGLDDDTLEKVKTQAAGLKWLYEMEILNSPQLINNLKLNIFNQDSTIKDVELLIDQNTKAILIYIQLSWWGRKFRQDRIKMSIEDLITQLLPTYRKRVVSERWIFDLALKKVREFIGGKNEKPTITDSNGNNVDLDKQGRVKISDELQKTSDLLPDQEEQKINNTQESDGIKQRDLQDDKKAQGSS